MGSSRQAPWEVEEEEWRELMGGEGRIPWRLKLAVVVIDPVAWPGWGRAGLQAYCWDGETQRTGAPHGGGLEARGWPLEDSPQGARGGAAGYSNHGVQEST